MNRVFKSLLGVLVICGFTSGQQISPNKVIPTAKQIQYQEMEFIGFIHFNMNTFTDKEWGYGDEDPEKFNPARLNVEQWARVAKDVGMKELILTAKHHDGFCLWPSAFTKHSIKYSPYKNSKGDIVREFTDACRKYGLRAGIYLSPWDRNNSSYGTPAYIEYYENQLHELLEKYGEINEVWFDGANGGDGYYGGAREKRVIDQKTYYPWKDFANIVYELQPQASIFSDAGPDLRWIGNENGFAGETFWSTIDAEKLVIGASDEKYLNTGDPHGKQWLVGVCDVSIRPGWFYHSNEDSLVKSPEVLVDLYFKSVGRNAVFLLNIPPDRSGAFSDNDVRSLQGFKRILGGIFSKNLALKGKVTASNSRSENFGPSKTVDGDNSTYWAAKESEKKATVTVKMDSSRNFDTILLQEPIQLGQRISSFSIEVFNNGRWEEIGSGTTVGFKRLLRVNPVRTDQVRLLIKDAIAAPALSNFALYDSRSGH